MLRIILSVLLLMPLNAQADGVSGEFDYYVLSLSWSPNWCSYEGDDRNSPQCDDGQDFGWVMHGLWPQYENGWPANCNTTHRAPTRRQTSDMADIMGSSGSAWHQWNKHGTCSGLSSSDYYALMRLAYARVTRPQILRDLTRDVTLPANLIEQAFLRDNDTITADGITITCKNNAIQEARICLTRELEPRECGYDTRRDCTADSALFEAID